MFRALIIMPPNLSSNSSQKGNTSQETISLINSDGSPSSVSNNDENTVSTWKLLSDPTIALISSDFKQNVFTKFLSLKFLYRYYCSLPNLYINA